ncbi:MAG: cell division protein FtsZ [Clostridia bacterium]|nr:cell division protein FtsZ [Clostridia bacterium]
MAMELINDDEQIVCIKCVGVGGGGGNAVNRMIRSGVESVDYVAVNTDAQALLMSKAPTKIQIGAKTTMGRGAGADAEKGQRSAEESREEIANALRGAQMVFITAGMGGGTGTGASPVIAEVAKEMGILTVAIVTKPFGFEGTYKMEQAEMGITALMQHVDSLVVVPNDRLKLVSEEKITLLNAFDMADDILRQGIQSVSDLIKLPDALINLDFADVCAVMKDAGLAHMGVGHATGPDKAVEAAKAAISSPLLETSINGARGVILNFAASPDIALDDVETAANMIREAAHPSANIIWGYTVDENMEDEMRVTVIATGFSGIPSGGKTSYSDPFEDLTSPFVFSVGKSSAPAAAPAAPAPQKKPQDDDNDDIPFTDFQAVMDMVNKRNRPEE